MNQSYILPNAWSLIEEGFDPSRVKSSESLFSIGNGAMGQRANFEEYYSGPTFQGSYMGGVYYPRQDKGRMVEKWLSRVFCQGTECTELDWYLH